MPCSGIKTCVRGLRLSPWPHAYAASKGDAQAAHRRVRRSAMAKGTKTGGGSRKGVPNKVSADVKAMILTALDKAGGAQYLLAQAHTNPNAFLTLVGKVLPMTVAGDPENPLMTGLTVTFVKPD